MSIYIYTYLCISYCISIWLQLMLISWISLYIYTMIPFDLTIIQILGFPWLENPEISHHPRHGTSWGDGHLQQWTKGGGTGGLCCLPRVSWVAEKKTPIGSMGMAYLQWQISRQIYQIYQSHGSVLRNHQPILRGSFWFCCSFNTGPSCFFPQRTRSDVFTDCIEYAAPIVVMIISWEMWHWGRPRHLGFPWFCGKNLLEWPRNSTPCELLPASLLEFLSAKRNVHFKFVHAAHYLEEIQEMLLGLIRKREEIPN